MVSENTAGIFLTISGLFYDFMRENGTFQPRDEDPGIPPATKTCRWDSGMASPVDEGFRTLVFYLPVCANGGKFSANEDRKSARPPSLATTPVWFSFMRRAVGAR
jgi:hypothetical protein